LADWYAWTAPRPLIGIEVKAAAIGTASDVRHLAWLPDQTGDAFAAGIVLHTGLDREPAAAVLAVVGEAGAEQDRGRSGGAALYQGQVSAVLAG
jgi:hypothetical protein